METEDEIIQIREPPLALTYENEGRHQLEDDIRQYILYLHGLLNSYLNMGDYDLGDFMSWAHTRLSEMTATLGQKVGVGDTTIASNSGNLMLPSDNEISMLKDKTTSLVKRDVIHVFFF